MFEFFMVFGAIMLCIIPILLVICLVRTIRKKKSKTWWVVFAISVLLFFAFEIIAAEFECKHEYKLVDEVQSTCTEKGYLKYHCDECDRDKTDKIDELGHLMKIVSRVEPTEQLEGEIVRQCERCGYEEVEIVSKLSTENSEENETLSKDLIESESPNESTVESEQSSSNTTNDDTTYVSLEEGQALKEIAGEYAQSFANRPSTIEFDSMSWWVMRNDTTYTVEGYFTCDNGFGASEKYKINVICLMSEDKELLVCMVAINDKVVVDNTEELLGAE